MALITLDDAKARLEIDFADQDATAQQMLAEAEDIVLGYLKKPSDHGWTPETVPPRIRSAILLVFAGLFERRSGQDELLTKPVRDLLERDRDPALA